MWPLSKRFRAWLMNEIRSLGRSGPQSQALHRSYDKAGLVLHDAAVPWNADAVLIEASLKLPASAQRKADFSLRLPPGEPVPAETLRPEEGGERHRIFFRLPPPPYTTEVALFWRDRQLGT